MQQRDKSADRGTQLRQRQVGGLLILAILVLALILARAHWHELFPTGWWRP